MRNAVAGSSRGEWRFQDLPEVLRLWLHAPPVVDEYELGNHHLPLAPLQIFPVFRCRPAAVPRGDGQHLSPGWDTSHCLLAAPGQPAHQGASQCPEAPGLTGLVDDKRVSGLQLPDGVGHMVTAGPARERQVDVPEGQSPANLRRLRFGRAVVLRRFPEQDGSVSRQ